LAAKDAIELLASDPKTARRLGNRKAKSVDFIADQVTGMGVISHRHLTHS
jgi:hypothetical protein